MIVLSLFPQHNPDSMCFTRNGSMEMGKTLFNLSTRVQCYIAWEVDRIIGIRLPNQSKSIESLNQTAIN